MNEAIVLLVLLWAAVLIPGAVRSRAGSPLATVGGFKRAMDVLRKPQPGRHLMVLGDPERLAGEAAAPSLLSNGDDLLGAAGDQAALRARRRSWLLRLVAATGVSLLLAVVVSGWMWLAFVTTLLVTAAYIGMLRHLKVERDEARDVVHMIDRIPESEVWAEGWYGADADEFEPQVAAAGAGSGVRLRRWNG